MIVADTNLISELMRTRPEPSVVRWVERVEEPLVTTAITIAEIRFGIERLPSGARRKHLVVTADALFHDLRDQILPFDASAAAHYATIAAQRQGAGRPMSSFDAQIAAICRATGAGLATRNVTDFERLDIAVINPWD